MRSETLQGRSISVRTSGLSFVPSLRQLVPDADSVVAMHPADLAGYVLEVLMTLSADERGAWNRRNFCIQAAQEFSQDYRNQGPHAGVSEACAVAWSWLEANWLICSHPEQGNDWYIPTKRGKEVRDRTGVRRLIERSELPEHFLHDTLIRDVLPLFLQARCDLAVFEAFHRLEIAIRDASNLGDELIGTKSAFQNPWQATCYLQGMKAIVSDELWNEVGPLLPKRRRSRKGGRPQVPDRDALRGILFVLATGAPWSALPPELGCGSGVTCWRRLQEWQRRGVWGRRLMPRRSSANAPELRIPHAERDAGSESEAFASPAQTVRWRWAVPVGRSEWWSVLEIQLPFRREKQNTRTRSLSRCSARQGEGAPPSSETSLGGGL